jgi:hypothetical protein
MKNKDDYDNGWTKPVFNPSTGKTCSGGAARNLRTAQAGGAQALFNMGGIAVMQHIEPLVNNLQKQLQDSQVLYKLFLQFLNKKEIVTTDFVNDKK